ncbi:MAG: acyl-CoA dehydrogenase [Sphingomonas sp.]|nr:acyl-CoA dehydrogenase [Sphingomonas sp.]
MRRSSIAAVIEAADAIAGPLAELGAQYDARPAYPADSIALLSNAGLLRAFAPGARWSDRESEYHAMFEALRRIGRADLSLGRLFEGHVNALQLFGWYGDKGQLHWLSKALEGGAMFGIWASEPAPGVQLVGEEGEMHLTGAKHFASGAGGIDHAIVTAKQNEAGRRLIVVSGRDAARADNRAWQVRGMRATQSGSYDLTGMSVAPIALLGGPGDYDREPRFTGGAWRFCAVQLGGIEALVQRLRALMSEDARADPVRRARFADCVIAARTAYLWVREAMMRAARDGEDMVPFVLATRGVVERSALDVMEGAARLIGTRSAMAGERADKIIRDLSLYLRQAGPDHARDRAAESWLERDIWAEDRWW